jgi:hypothetical protein
LFRSQRRQRPAHFAVDEIGVGGAAGGIVVGRRRRPARRAS